MPWRMIVISDSAFQGKDLDHLALRSGIIALMGNNRALSGEVPLQVLDTVSKKQSRVCRSTLQAELHSSLDLYGQAVVMAHWITEALHGNMTASQLAERYDKGALHMEIELVIDAKSVLEALRPEQLRVSDKVTTIHLLRLAEHLQTGQISRLTWLDTRDMLADALNKAVIERGLIRPLCERGTWTIRHEVASIQRKQQQQQQQTGHTTTQSRQQHSSSTKHHQHAFTTSTHVQST